MLKKRLPLSRRELGRIVEDDAAKFITKIGMSIIARNLRTPDAEIDILARDGDTIVIIEVKARFSKNFGSALGSVDRKKRLRLRSAAEDLMQYLPEWCTGLRFDVVTFEYGCMKIHRDAF